MKVIFLDVDGELTYSDYRNKETCDIDLKKVKLLKEICDKTGAQVVISSSWRGIPGLVPHIYSVLLKILSDYEISVIGEIPYIKTEFVEENPFKTNSPVPLRKILSAKVKHGTGRAAEIERWINENKPEKFVILDDEDYDWADYGYDTHWVRPTWYGNGGLKREHVEKAVEILGCKSKYIKVMFNTTSGFNSSQKFNVNKETISEKWNPSAPTPEEMGGFCFSNEENILRWFVRGSVLYDVKVPGNAQIINCPNPNTPNGVFKSNRIIITNPRPITDDLAMYYYKKSNMPEKTYYKALAGLALRGCAQTARQLIQDRINDDNIDEAIKEFNEFPKPYRPEDNKKVYEEILQTLNEIKHKKGR